MMCRQKHKTVYAVMPVLTEFLNLSIEFYFAREQIRRVVVEVGFENR